MKHSYYIIVILTLILAFFLYMEFGPKKVVTVEKPIEKIVYKTDTTYVPEVDTFLQYQNKHIYHQIIKHDTITQYKDIDSLDVVMDYLSKLAYNDTISIDTFGYIVVVDTLWKNRIYSRKVYKRIEFKPYTPDIPKLRNKVFVGLGVNGWNDKFGASANIALLTKRNHLYNLGYDPINKSLGISIYWRLSFNK